MTQNYLLSSAARTLSSLEVARLSDDEAFDLLCRLRWGSKEIVSCPKCGTCDKHYWISTRQQWRCKNKECRHTFSVTSGTIFANRKKPIQDYLFFIAEYVNAVKGISAPQLARNCNMNYRTAFVLSHKLRKALLEKRVSCLFSGEVDMDGTYVHPAPRKANKKSDRIDYRLKENQSPDKRCIVVAREHYTPEEKAQNQHSRGAKATQVFVTFSETRSVIQKIAEQCVERGTKINTDESHAYDVLMPFYNLCTVNHKEEYRSDEGITNNQAESYFSRFKRMYYGQVHKMSNQYLLGYANEAAYREDNRRKSNGWQFEDVLGKCLTTANANNEWCGYWQRKHIAKEVLLH